MPSMDDMVPCAVSSSSEAALLFTVLAVFGGEKSDVGVWTDLGDGPFGLRGPAGQLGVDTRERADNGGLESQRCSTVSAESARLTRLLGGVTHTTLPFRTVRRRKLGCRRVDRTPLSAFWCVQW